VKQVQKKQFVLSGVNSSMFKLIYWFPLLTGNRYGEPAAQLSAARVCCQGSLLGHRILTAL